MRNHSMRAAMADPAYFPIFGAENQQGTNIQSDVLVSHTSDGVDLNTVYADFAQMLAIFNEQRGAIASLLSYPTTRQVDVVQQSVGGATFEVASEFGVPKGSRAPDVATVGYGFEDYDIASRLTWKFLRDSDIRQIGAVHDNVMEGANKLTTTAVLERLFNPEQTVSPEGNAVYGLYNADGSFVPPYLGRDFDPATETHYLTTGSAVLDPSDIEALMDRVAAKGYSADSGRKLVILANPIDAKRIAQFRVGVPGADGVDGHFDFVASSAAPARLVVESIVGDVAPSEWNGLPVIGSYGPAYVIESHFIPVGYLTVVASAGPNAEGNPVAIREHVRTEYRGLRLIPGADQRYPIVSSYYAIGFGTGIRHRGAAACLQITTNAEYTAPTFPR